jgi:hypothetical protein
MKIEYDDSNEDSMNEVKSFFEKIYELKSLSLDDLKNTIEK